MNAGHQHFHTQHAGHDILPPVNQILDLTAFHLFSGSVTGSFAVQIIAVKYMAMVFAQHGNGTYRPLPVESAAHQENAGIHLAAKRFLNHFAEIHVSLFFVQGKPGPFSGFYKSLRRSDLTVDIQAAKRHLVPFEGKKSHFPAPKFWFLRNSIVVKTFIISLQKASSCRKLQNLKGLPQIFHQRSGQTGNGHHDTGNIFGQIICPQHSQCLSQKNRRQRGRFDHLVLHLHRFLQKTALQQPVDENFILMSGKILRFHSVMIDRLPRLFADAGGERIMTLSGNHRKRNRLSLRPVKVADLGSLFSHLEPYDYISDFIHLLASHRSGLTVSF